jgi:cysteine desulfurase/selenocysteine lyase
MEINELSAAEVQRLRAETKGAAARIHFNNAGASLPPDVVVSTVTGYLNEEAVLGGYEVEAKYRQQLDDTYASIARLINAEPEEVALMENASMGWCLGFHGINFKEGDEVIVSELEYVTNIIGALNAKKLYGIQIKVVYNDADGSFCLKKLEEAITDRTKLIAVTHIASTTGVVLPVAEIGKIANRHQILYLVDACQSVGQVPVDVKDIGCDILTVTGRKYLRAPRGTGFVYIKKEVQSRLKSLFIDGRSITWVSETDFKLRDDAKRFELYEKNRALTLGLAKAADYALDIGMHRIWQRIERLAGLLRGKLRDMDGITVHDTGELLCGIVTFSVMGMGSDLVKQKLAEKDINVSVGLAKSTLLFMNKNNLQSVVRASVHYYNTEEEIDMFCKALIAIKSTSGN